MLAGLAVLWTAAWFAAAEWLGGRLDQTIAAAAVAGVPVECGNRGLGGFPLRIAVTCERLSVQTPAGERTVSLTRAEAAAVAFPLGRIKAAAATPASAAWDGQAVALDWQTATAEIDLGLAGMKQSRADFGALKVGFETVALSAASVSATLGPIADQAASAIAVASADTVVETGGRSSAPFRLTIDAIVAVPPPALLAGAIDPARDGLSIPLFAARAGSGTGAAAVLIDGDLTAGPDGLANGDFTLTLVDPGALYEWLDSLPQELADTGSVAMSLAAFMGEPVSVDGSDGLRLAFSVEQGTIVLGGTVLGQIPPLY